MSTINKQFVTAEILAEIPDSNKTEVETFLENNASARILVNKILSEKRRENPNLELEEAYKNKILELLSFEL